MNKPIDKKQQEKEFLYGETLVAWLKLLEKAYRFETGKELSYNDILEQGELFEHIHAKMKDIRIGSPPFSPCICKEGITMGECLWVYTDFLAERAGEGSFIELIEKIKDNND